VRLDRRLFLLLLSLSPVWVLLLTGGLSSAWLTNTVNFAGIPLGLALLLLAAVLTVVGVLGVRSWRRPDVALVALTMPAAAIVLFGPAVILIVENLGNGT
jgi:hypothetical protein